MLVTLDFFNGTYRLANHNIDSTADFISSLTLTSMSIKRGLAVDSAIITIPMDVLDLVVDELVYLILDTPVKIEFYDNSSQDFKYGIDGYISKLATKSVNSATLTISSKISYHMKQMFIPEVAATCQNQLFSTMCGLDKANFVGSDTGVVLDCLTGVMDYTAALEAAHGSIENLNLAYVVLNNYFKTRVIGIDRINKKLYLAMNFLDKTITVDVSIYLYCNKTYGQCYTRFDNVKNFYGFASKGQQVSNFDIFSATGLTYCGEDAAQLPAQECSTDNNIFGIDL